MEIRIKKSSLLYVVIIVGCLILGGFYYLTEKSKTERQFQFEREKEEQRESKERVEEIMEKHFGGAKYEECMSDSYKNYVLNWNSSCKSRGLQEECQLPTETATRLDNERHRAEDRCFELYGK